MQTQMIDDEILGSVDLVALGARTGMLWRSGATTIVGLGGADILPIDRSAGGVDVREALEALRGVDGGEAPGTGPIGLTALPFDPAADGVVVVPGAVICETGGHRYATLGREASLGHLVEEVSETLARPASEPPKEVRLSLDRAADTWRDEVVRTARDRLRNSDVEKAVLARLLTLQASSDFAVDRIISDLGRRFEHANLFAVDGFIGASPELLVSRHGRTVRAHPLAGTALRNSDPETDQAMVDALLASTKDRTEHRITIDWLLAELLPFCSYVDAEPAPSIVTLANVHHLGTLVEGLLSEPAASILDLVAAVHPTPAVGGNPQSDALELIAELEGFDRGRYGGPVGWVDAAGNGEFAVSVRTAQVHGSTAAIAAGVGVVAQSDPDAELIETQAKFQAMLGSFLKSPRR